MKYLLFALINFSSLMLFSQTTMTVHMSTGEEYTIDINDIDSISFTLDPPPPTFNIYGSSGDLFLPLYDIDSITYTIAEITGLLIETKPISLITNTSANSGGIILDDGGYTILVKGVLWGTEPNPVLGQNFTEDGDGSTEYNSVITDLLPGVTYYVRAYAYTEQGIAYAPEISFQTTSLSTNHLNPDVTYGFVEDIDGNVYHTVTIGDQEWMAENLRTTRYSNGDPIPNLPNLSQWSNTTTGAWSNYNNQPAYDYPLGKYYNGYAIRDSRGVCPTGWRVPREFEYNILEANYSGNLGAAAKSTDPTYWASVGANVTNLLGFSALGAGYRETSLDFYNYGNEALFWTETIKHDTLLWSTEVDTSLSHASFWKSSDYMMIYYANGHNIGLNVRCLRKTEGLDEVGAPSVLTITSSSVDVTGFLINTPMSGDPEVGFIWSTETDPILTHNVVPAVLDGTTFSAQLTGLLPNTRYYVRAYSTNVNGTDYGRVVPFITPY
jgi:uncharacterized protein (TIGR02145 family)